MGATVTVYGATELDALNALRKAILQAYPGRQPDSDAATVNPSEKKGRAFTVEIKTAEDGEPYDVCFTLTEKAKNVGMPLSVSRLYGRKPKRGEYLATVHVR